MQCPRCTYHSPYEVVRCPQCLTTFDAEVLEELTHLNYLRTRLAEWQEEGLLPAEAVARAVAVMEREATGLEEHLGLRAVPSTVEPVVVAPPAAVSDEETVAGSRVPAEEGAQQAGVAAPPEAVPAEAQQEPAPDAEREPVAAPAGPAFSWRDLGSYLLAERTLNALLGLGAFLILASGVVISTLNPTGLSPVLHLGVVALTTAVFYGIGYVVRQRLGLTRTGAALLAIGGAFVPLDIWTLGYELLGWQHSTIWLVASLFCLPVYLASHAVLRDRTFAVLTALAGGSEVLSVAHWLGIPLEWGFCALVVLALGYVALTPRLQERWRELAWALFWTAQLATPAVLALLMAAKYVPDIWAATAGQPWGGLYEYAIGGAWWLGTAFYARCARLFGRRQYQFAAAWTLPFAFLFTLTKAPWDPEWYNLCLALLAVTYLAFGRWWQRITPSGATGTVRGLLTRPAYQVGAALTIIAVCWPFQTLDSSIPTLYVVSGSYGLAAYLFRLTAPRYGAAYLLPVTVALSLEKLSQTGIGAFAPTWHNVAFALLAGAYVVAGRAVLPAPAAGGYTYRAVLREPVLQVAVLLTLVAAFWDHQTPASALATLTILSIVYGAAAALLGQRAWAYIAAFLLPVAYARLLEQVQLSGEMQPLAWAALAGALLAGAEYAARRTGEERRPLWETLSGLGGWQSRFAAPLFAAGSVVRLLALVLALASYFRSPALAGVRIPDTAVILAFFALVALYVGSAVARRTSFYLYPATWLLLLPLTSGAGLVFRRLDVGPAEHDWARLLAIVGVGYLAVAYATDRAGGHYAKPVYLVGYFLSAATMFLSVLDRAANVQVIGLSLLVYAGSAWLVHQGRHPAFLWCVARLAHDPASLGAQTARSYFVYLVAWLFPAWLLLALSLWQPSPAAAHYGLALTLLAPVYIGLGRWFQRIAPAYRWPWYLGGYALSAIGPLVATPDPSLRTVALALAIALYAGSTLVFRQSGWLWLVALLTPLLLWQVTEHAGLPAQFLGLALLVLALAYSIQGLTLHHGPARRVAQPIPGVIGAFALPFFVVSYGLDALGLALVVNQERGLIVLGSTLAALHYAGSGYIFRQSIFSYPLTITGAVAYVVGMTMTPLDARLYGLGLLPGIVGYLAVAEVLRRRLDTLEASDARGRVRLASALEAWSLPFYAVLYAGTVAAPALSYGSQGIWALSWWSSAAVFGASAALLRHPVWLYPAVGAGVAGYLATAYFLLPDLSLSHALASLVAPTWLLLWAAYAVVRWHPGPAAGVGGLAARGEKPVRPELVEGRATGGSTSSPRTDYLSCLLLRVPAGPEALPAVGMGRALAHRWAAPLAICGLLVLGLSTLGTVYDARAGLWTAVAYAVLLATFAVVWQGQLEAWGSLIFVGLAFQQGLRLAGVPVMDQPPRWAVLALFLTLLAYLSHAPRFAALSVWRGPLFTGSIAIGVAAVVAALGVQLVMLSRTAFPTLSATAAVTGLTLLAHSYARRTRLLAYLGVALLEVGYMLQLVLFDVGQPQAFVLPAGVYLLAIAYLEWRRGTDPRLKATLETGALVLLLGVSLIQAVGFLGAGYDRYVYDTFLLFESLAVFGVGAALRWKKPFFAGSLALVVDVLILLSDPLRAMNTWYLMGIVGISIIGMAVLVEKRRQQIPVWVDQWRQRLEAWD